MLSDEERWRGKVIVITGATAGVGRATACHFAREGASVVLLARDNSGLEDTAREVHTLGGRALPLSVDVADADAVYSAAARAEAHFGSIDVWINNAMVTVFAPVAELTPAEYRRVTEVTYLGAVHGTMAALRHMRPHNRGVIVQVGSALSYRAIPLQSAYCGAKFAIRGFTDALRSELIHERTEIAVAMVQLPAINTPQFDWARTHMPRQPRPAGSVYQPEVAARAILQAAAYPSRERWPGASTIQAIFGSIAAPGMADALLSKLAGPKQARAESVSPDRRDNLFSPLSGCHTAHGSFDRQAGDSALSISGTEARVFALCGAMAAAAILCMAARRLGGR